MIVDNDSLPIWDDPKTSLKRREQCRKSQRKAREKQKQARFEEQAEKPVNWSENIRTATTGSKPFGYCSIEALYRAFKARLIEEFEEEFGLNNLILARRVAQQLDRLFEDGDVEAWADALAKDISKAGD